MTQPPSPKLYPEWVKCSMCGELDIETHMYFIRGRDICFACRREVRGD